MTVVLLAIPPFVSIARRYWPRYPAHTPDRYDGHSVGRTENNLVVMICQCSPFTVSPACTIVSAASAGTDGQQQETAQPPHRRVFPVSGPFGSHHQGARNVIPYQPVAGVRCRFISFSLQRVNKKAGTHKVDTGRYKTAWSDKVVFPGHNASPLSSAREVSVRCVQFRSHDEEIQLPFRRPLTTINDRCNDRYLFYR